MIRRATFALGLLLAACSSPESTHEFQIASSPDSTVLATVNEQVTALRVDDERVYWAGTTIEANRLVGTLRSCRKQSCASTLVTYESGAMLTSEGFGLVGDEIVWFRFVSQALDESELVGCNVRGCGAGRRALTRVHTQRPGVVGFTHDAVYLASDQLFRIPLPAGGTPQFVAPLGSTVRSLTERGELLYLLENSPTLAATENAIFRQRPDPATLPELLIDHLPIQPESLTSDSLLAHPRAIAATFGHLYWLQGGTTGDTIARCPLSGCSGEPERVVVRLQSPSDLQVDDADVYWLHVLPDATVALSGCSTAKCVATPPIVTGVVALQALTLDDDYVYTATGNRPSDPTTIWADRHSQIRKFPR